MPLNTRAMALMSFRLAPDGKRIAVGTQSTWGLLDDAEDMVDDGTGEPVTVRTRVVHFTVGTLTGVEDGTTMTVGTETYVVRGRPMPRENGDLLTVRVTQAAP
jgi:hypothetical protein